MIQSEFFVSPEGSDNNQGTLEKPFFSLERARDAIRNINGTMRGDIVVNLRGGIYHVKEAIVLDGRDSSTNGYNTIYKAYADEKPTLSGGVKVSGWKRVKHCKIRNLWKADVPEVEYTRHFFINGENISRTKSKVVDAGAWNVLQDQEMTFYNQLDTFTSYQGAIPVYEGYKTPRKEMVYWKNQEDIEFVYDVGWTHSICPVDKITPGEDGAIVKMREPCFRDCQIKGGVQIGSPNYIENVFELLETPGEWYFDRKTKEVYYISRDGENMEKVEAIMPAIEMLLQIRGTLERPVKNLQFIGLAFMHTTYLRPVKTGHAEVQANLIKDPQEDEISHTSFIKMPSSIVLDAAENIMFFGCEFSRLGNGAIDIQNGSRDNRMIGNRFIHIAGSGVQVGGFTIKDAHPEDEREIVMNNGIINNYFYDIGTDYKGSVGVIAGYTNATQIVHNEICNVAYSGISVGWGWGYWDEGSDDRLFYKPLAHYPRFHKPTVAGNNRIQYNHVHHVMQKLHDGGGIYTLSMQPGSVIQGNLVHDNGGMNGEGYCGDIMNGNGQTYTEEERKVPGIQGFPGGIYMDECSGGFVVSENIIYNVVVPINYHLAAKDRDKTNQFYSNYCRLKPGDKGFPVELARRAGLEEEFKHLKI